VGKGVLGRFFSFINNGKMRLCWLSVMSGKENVGEILGKAKEL